MISSVIFKIAWDLDDSKLLLVDEVFQLLILILKISINSSKFLTLQLDNPSIIVSFNISFNFKFFQSGIIKS